MKQRIILPYNYSGTSKDSCRSADTIFTPERPNGLTAFLTGNQ